jgi:hypothetical protein
MNRSLLKFLVPIALPFVPMLAAAGPGAAVTTLQVLPLDVQKVTAAYDKLMASAVGKQFKGRLILLSHLADGADPASVTVLSLYHSAAEYETYTNALMDSAARTELLTEVVPIAQLVLTARTATVKSWGDINDTDAIWENFYFNVTDYPAFVAALDAFLASPAGKRAPGQGYLIAIDDAGAAPGTPNFGIAVGYASQAERETYGDSLANDPDWTKYVTASAKSATLLGADLSRTLKVWGPAAMKSFTTK